MRTLYYLILVASGILLSIPITIWRIAQEQAAHSSQKIKQYLLDKDLIDYK